MRTMRAGLERLPLAALALGALLALGACANAVGPTAPGAPGGVGSLSRTNDWGFGTRSQTSGYVFDRAGSA